MDESSKLTEELKDRVLLVLEEELAAQISSLLSRRGYEIIRLSPNQSLYDLAEAPDLIISAPVDGESVLDTATRIRAQSIASHLPLILLYSEQQSLKNVEKDYKQLAFLTLPIDPTALLVKTSMFLRLHKLAQSDARREASLIETNAKLRELTNRYSTELREAQQVQQALLPQQLPNVEGLRFAVYFNPLGAVGGDLYDIWTLADNRIGIFIADVTGHGLPAAFVGAMAKMALAYAHKTDSATMLSEVNQGLCPLLPEGRYLTGAVLLLSPSDYNCSLSIAGHPAPLLIRNNEVDITPLAQRSMPLGFSETAIFQSHEFTLGQGDRVLFYTDGVTELSNMDGKQLGEVGLIELLSKLRNISDSSELIKSLTTELTNFSEGRIVKDDITLLLVERTV